MLRTHHSFLASALLCALVLLAACVTALGQTGQTASVANPKLSLNAALVLTPEFCATKTKKGTWLVNQETFPIGKAACAEFEPALRGVFSSLTRLESDSSSGDAEVVLMPRFVDIAATQTLGAFSNRELVVLVEWTVKDKSGKTVWVETVQGSAKHHMGNAFSHNKNLKRIVEDSLKDVAETSASKMSSSPEIRKLDQKDTDSGVAPHAATVLHEMTRPRRVEI
jgi:hypothetical protein